jgi:hypothetical protein
MKRLTTIICCVALMIAGVATAFFDFSMPGNQTALAQPAPFQWNVTGKLPLDLQLDLEKRLQNETPIRDSINIIDSVRYVDKVRWKTRYKDVAARTVAREMGNHPIAVNPDSMSVEPFYNSTPNREEQLGEYVETPKVPTIQLQVDGVVVYNSEDEIHSAGEGQ